MADEVKDSKLIIMDLRYKTGDADPVMKNWVETFTGEEPVIKGAYCRKNKYFGMKDFDDDLSVFQGDEKLVNYEVSFADPSCGTATIKEDGTLHLKAKKRGIFDIYITVNGEKFTYKWVTEP